MKAKLHLWRWTAALLAAGCVFQAGSCAGIEQSLAELSTEVVRRQTANLVSDTVFFLLDNALVRLTS